MERYANRGGDSGVSYFEIGEDSITVQFSIGGTYLYNYSSAGSHNIEQMKSYARRGSGLNSFINTYVKRRYARKIR